MEAIGEENNEGTNLPTTFKVRKKLIVVDKSDKVSKNRHTQPLQEIKESAEPNSFRKKIKDFYDKSEDPSFKQQRYQLDLIQESAAELKSEEVNLKHISNFQDKTEKVNQISRGSSNILEEVNEEASQQQQFIKQQKPFYDKIEGLPAQDLPNASYNLEQICEEKEENKVQEIQINKGNLNFCDKTEKTMKKIKSFEYLQKIEEIPEKDQIELSKIQQLEDQMENYDFKRRKTGGSVLENIEEQDENTEVQRKQLQIMVDKGEDYQVKKSIDILQCIEETNENEANSVLLKQCQTIEDKTDLPSKTEHNVDILQKIEEEEQRSEGQHDLKHINEEIKKFDSVGRISKYMGENFETIQEEMLRLESSVSMADEENSQ